MTGTLLLEPTFPAPRAQRWFSVCAFQGLLLFSTIVLIVSCRNAVLAPFSLGQQMHPTAGQSGFDAEGTGVVTHLGR